MLAELKLKTYRKQQGEIDNEYPLDVLIDEWLIHAKQKLKPSTLRRYKQNIGNLKAKLSARLVSWVTPDRIEAFRQDRLDVGVTARTVNMDVGCLQTILNWAVRRKKIHSNPIRDLRALPHFPKEARAFRSEEVEKLLAAATSPRWRDVWYAYLTTGLRKMELAHLTFNDVDWEAHELIVRGRTAKNSKSRRVPIEDGLYEILRRQYDEAPFRVPGNSGGAETRTKVQRLFSKTHVFVTGQNTPLGINIYREFMTTCRRAGIKTVTYDGAGNVTEFVDLHSTRHTFATELVRANNDPKTVQEILGHKTLEMTMRIYAKVHGTSKHTAVATLPYGKTGGQAGVVKLPEARTGRAQAVHKTA
jgi:integrase